MKNNLNLQSAKQVAIALASAPSADSKIILAEDQDFLLLASRNRFKGGFAVHLQDRKSKERYAVVGYKAEDIGAKLPSVEDVIAIGNQYASRWFSRCIGCGEMHPVGVLCPKA